MCTDTPDLEVHSERKETHVPQSITCEPIIMSVHGVPHVTCTWAGDKDGRPERKMSNRYIYIRI